MSPRALWRVCRGTVTLPDGTAHSCPTMIPAGTMSGLCPDCTKRVDAGRGTPAQRGYGRDHQRLRRQWAPKVAAGTVTCSLCPNLIQPGEPWHLDHEPGTDRYRGPAHASCNSGDGGRRGLQGRVR